MTQVNSYIVNVSRLISNIPAKIIYIAANNETRTDEIRSSDFPNLMKCVDWMKLNENRSKNYSLCQLK